MNSTGEFYSFCIFCCRKYLQLKPARHKNDLKLFIKLLGRFVCSKTVLLSHFNQLNALDYSMVECCGDCWLTVDKFCEIYHQFKCFELQLDWKIERLFNVIKLANKVPSRISQLEKALHDIADKEDNQDIIAQTGKFKLVKDFRHLISKHCCRRLARSQPRVILKKNDLLCSSSNIGLQEIEEPITKATIAHCLRQNAQTQITKQEPNLSLLDDETILEDACRTVTNVEQTDALFENNRLFDNFIPHEIHNDDDDFLDDANDETFEHNSITTENVEDIQSKLDSKHVENFEIISQNENIPIPNPTSSIAIQNTALSTFPKESTTTNHLYCKICKKTFKTEKWLTTHNNKFHLESCSPNYSNKNDSSGQINLKLESRDENVALQKVDEVDQKFNTNYADSDCDISLTLNKNASVPTSPPEYKQRYQLRQRKAIVSIKLEELSSSATSESEDDKEVPLKKKKTTRKQYQKTTTCKICNKEVLHKKRHFRTNHDKARVNEKNIFKCEEQGCQAYFLRVDQLRLHCVNVHNVSLPVTQRKIPSKRKPIYRCRFCREAFPAQFLLSRHKSKCTPIDILAPTPKNPDIKNAQKNDFTCNFCDHSTNSPSNLAIHETNHAPSVQDQPNSKTSQCPRCPYQYMFKRRYILHHLRHHLKLLSINSPGACTMCSSAKIYTENNKLHFDVQHNTDLLDDPTKIFKCDECPAYFVQSFQLHRHKIRVHLNNTCTECGKVFKSKQGLGNHMKTVHKFDEESPELPVSCNWPECLKRFATEGEMDFHIRYTHKRKREDTRIRSELCPKCGKAFKSSGVLKYHMRTAHVEKSYICSQCGKRFRDTTTLKVHMEYHKSPDEWKFECKECGKKCVDKEKLEQHLRTHTKEKPWVCQFCGEKYAHRHNWKNHLKRKHGDEKGVQDQVSRKKTGSFLSRKGTQKGDCILAGVKV